MTYGDNPMRRIANAIETRLTAEPAALQPVDFYPDTAAATPEPTQHAKVTPEDYAEFFRVVYDNPQVVDNSGFHVTYADKNDTTPEPIEHRCTDIVRDIALIVCLIALFVLAVLR